MLRKLERRLRRPLPVVWVPRGVEPEIGTLLRAEKPARAVAALASMRSSAPSFLQRIWYVSDGEHGLTITLRDHFEIRLGGESIMAASYGAPASIAFSRNTPPSDMPYKKRFA